MRNLWRLLLKEPRRDVGVRPAVGGGPATARQEPSSGGFAAHGRDPERKTTPVTLLDVTGVTDTTEVKRSKRLVLPLFQVLVRVTFVSFVDGLAKVVRRHLKLANSYFNGVGKVELFTVCLVFSSSCAGSAVFKQREVSSSGEDHSVEVGVHSNAPSGCESHERPSLKRARVDRTAAGADIKSGGSDKGPSIRSKP